VSDGTGMLRALPGVFLAVLACAGAAPPSLQSAAAQAADEAAGDRALLDELGRRLDSGSGLAAVGALERLVLRYPSGYPARRGIELFMQHESELTGQAISPAGVLLGLYPAARETDVAGHLLFHAASWHAAHTPAQAAGGPDDPRRDALYLLMLLVDHHPDSPLWDDAVWEGADLLRQMGYPGDETALLEEALLPGPGRGMDWLAGRFVQRVRFRLAGLYERQGRYGEALRQLGLVVNLHQPLPLKDDALWRAARIHATLGDVDSERKALRSLVEQCPWSRYVERARERQ